MTAPVLDTSAAKRKWWLLIIPLSILLLNVIYKILFLGARDITIDEPFTLFYSQMPLREIFHMLPGENNPPLHFLLMHAWISIFGIDPFQARLLSLMAGTGSALLIYFIGVRNFSIPVGITASLLFTFSNFNTYLAQEARVYALFIFLTLASAYLFLYLLRTWKILPFILLIIVNILLIYAHFFAFWIILVEFSLLFLFPGTGKKLLKPFLVMGIILALAYLPYLMVFIHRFVATSGGTWLEPPTLSSFYNLVWKYCNTPVTTVMVLLILTVGAGKFLYLRMKKMTLPDPQSLFLLLWFFLPTIGTFLISLALPLFYEKYLVFIAPALYLLVGKSIEYVFHRGWITTGVSLVLVAGFIITSTPRPFYTKSISMMAKDIEKLRKDNDPVVITPGYFDKTFVYHYNRKWFQDFRNFNDTLQAHALIPVSDPGMDLFKDLADCNRVFLIEAGSQYLDPEGTLYQNLMLQFDSVQIIEYDEVNKLYILLKR